MLERRAVRAPDCPVRRPGQHGRNHNPKGQLLQNLHPASSHIAAAAARHIFWVRIPGENSYSHAHPYSSCRHFCRFNGLRAGAQTQPDTLIFVNGEQLTGALEKADAKGITFKSDMAGEVSVKWSNVKELRTDKQFALLTANQKLTRKDAMAVVPQGKITVSGDDKQKEIVVATASGPKTVPLAQAGPPHRRRRLR